jgi:hypothetical protein
MGHELGKIQSETVVALWMQHSGMFLQGLRKSMKYYTVYNFSSIILSILTEMYNSFISEMHMILPALCG